VNPEGAEPKPKDRDRAGEVVAGRYRLDSLLGKGGMGYVYRATHLELDEPVVVKFIDPAYAQDPIARKRFRREAKALIRLRNPGIVTMHEFGEHAGGLFLVMELLEGQTLGARMASSSEPFTLDTIFAIFHQLGAVLDAVHAAGVIHRDIKPDNVMLVPNRTASTGPNERAVLMDFGLAHLEEAREMFVSRTGAVMGTPYYMSPEQCYGTGVCLASDIYSLGVVLFEVISGRRPFVSETAAVLMSHHMFVAPPKLEHMASGQAVPLALVKLVEDMLGKKPENRPTAMQFLQRMEEARLGTDAVTFAVAASERRLIDVMKTREERALPAAHAIAAGPQSGFEKKPTVLAPQTHAVRPLVWLRSFPAERAGKLVASLAVNGIEAICGDTLAILGVPELRGELNGIILLGTESSHAPEAVRELRHTPECTTVPVLVIDVPQSSEIAELIRAGASDVALSILGDDVVVSKIWRLIRRKR
jgi:serine/threonine-protein kinase